MQATLTPHIAVHDGASALSFYGRALDARELFRLTDPRDGRVGHAEIEIDGARFTLSDPYPEVGVAAPHGSGGSPVTLNLLVKDVDATTAKAKAAGMTVMRPPQDESFGERVAVLMDPYGHRWMFAQHLEKVSPEEMQRRWNAG